MSRRLFAGTFAALLAVGLFAAAAAGLGGDPQKTVDLKPGEAALAVSSFIGGAQAANELTVTGPTEGDYLRVYGVLGDRLAATVDAHTGAVVTLVVGSAISVGRDGQITEGDAQQTAAGFLTDHKIATDGLVGSTRFANHGESSEYVVEWTRHIGDVIVPDTRLVGVDAASGQVFRYVNVNRPYSPPADPTVDRSKAIASAFSIVDRDGASVEDAVLRVTFADSGQQRLAWYVSITDAVGTDAGSIIAEHWLVEVDAASGDTILLASS